MYHDIAKAVGYQHADEFLSAIETVIDKQQTDVLQNKAIYAKYTSTELDTLFKQHFEEINKALDMASKKLKQAQCMTSNG